MVGNWLTCEYCNQTIADSAPESKYYIYCGYCGKPLPYLTEEQLKNNKGEN